MSVQPNCNSLVETEVPSLNIIISVKIKCKACMWSKGQMKTTGYDETGTESETTGYDETCTEFKTIGYDETCTESKTTGYEICI